MLDKAGTVQNVLACQLSPLKLASQQAGQNEREMLLIASEKRYTQITPVAFLVRAKKYMDTYILFS